MKRDLLISQFQKMYTQHWSYIWGKAEKGCVDCSGAFVYAFKLYHQSIYHGSNTIARHYIKGKLLPISDCKPGYAVFKWRDDGREPDKYKGDGIGNIFHIGLAGYDGHVLNAQGEKAGFTNTPLSKWHYCAPLKGVDYTEEVPKMTCTVTGGQLNIRSSCSTTSKLVDRAPDGAVLTFIGYAKDDSWSKVSYNGKTGYVLSKYIIIDGEVSLPSVEERVADLEEKLSQLEQRISALEGQ